MNAESKITAKGQTTIPLEVRELLGLQAGDRVRFVAIGDRVEIIGRNRPVSDIFGLLQSYGIKGTTLMDYKNTVAEAIAEKHGGEVSKNGQKL
jgi:antitoxin PrlF